MYVLMDLCNYLETGSAASGSVTSLVLKLEYGNQSLKNKNINNFYDTELEIEYFFVLSVLWDFENDFVCLFNLSIFFNFSLFCSIFQCRFFFLSSLPVLCNCSFNFSVITVFVAIFQCFLIFHPIFIFCFHF